MDLRDKLYTCIQKYGLNDERTLKASQEMDNHINNYHKKGVKK